MTNKNNLALETFKRYTEAKVLAFADAVIASLTNNTDFPNAAPMVAELVAAQSIYSVALSAAKDGSRLQAAEKNAAKEVVVDLLVQLCAFVNYIARGNRVMLLGSGFDVSKELITPMVIEPAKSIIINYGKNSGEMDINVKGVKAHKGLIFEYALATEKNEIAAEANWITQPSSTTKCTIVNMPVGQRVLIRIGITGSRKQLIYTAPVVRLVA